jgi:serine/threonine-protein kinase
VKRVRVAAHRRGQDVLRAELGPSTVGTVDYMAPQQIEGRQLDGRADVHAPGGGLFECLTGRPPFTMDPQRRYESAGARAADVRAAAVAQWWRIRSGS